MRILNVQKKDRKRHFTRILLIFAVIVLTVIPSIATADGTDDYDVEVAYGDTCQADFTYDGLKKHVKISCTSDEAIVFDFGPDADTYDYITSDGAVTTSLTLVINKRQISIKPQNISGEYPGYNVKPTAFEITGNTTLVNGHYIDPTSVTYGGVATGAGKTTTTISSDIRILDKNNYDADVTKNYVITKVDGLIDLSAPFVVSTDPVDEGQLAGGTSADPKIENQSSTNNETANDGTASLAATGTTSDTNEDTATIQDSETPLASGLGNVPNPLNKVTEEANTSAGTALFLAMFAVVAVVIISVIHYIRKRKLEKAGTY